MPGRFGCAILQRSLVQEEKKMMNEKYAEHEPARAEIDAFAGATLLEFGAPWCGYCQAAQMPLATALAGLPSLRHLKIEDGSGCPLGRSFRVKLWPTLIFLRDGQELARLVRPDDPALIVQALALIAPMA